jgi:hypothetical protein
MKILTFADMGIGNFVWYLPVLRALAQHDLTVVCPNEQLRAIIDYNMYVNYEIKGKYDVSVNNFLCQRNEDIKKIWRIPRRIGHDSWWRKKYRWMFTDKIPMQQDDSEEKYNCDLLIPLGITPIFGEIKFPNYIMPEYDIIISRYSTETKKDWEYWDELIATLKILRRYKIKILDPKEYSLIRVCDMISKCKLFIGNDSGMPKIAANLGVKTIQIFRWWTDSFVRARVKGINLIEPSVKEVLEYVENSTK